MAAGGDDDDANFVAYVQGFSDDEGDAPRKFRVVATGTMAEQSMDPGERDGSYHLRNFPLTRDQVMDLNVDIDPEEWAQRAKESLTSGAEAFTNISDANCRLSGRGPFRWRVQLQKKEVKVAAPKTGVHTLTRRQIEERLCSLWCIVKQLVRTSRQDVKDAIKECSYSPDLLTSIEQHIDVQDDGFAFVADPLWRKVDVDLASDDDDEENNDDNGGDGGGEDGGDGGGGGEDGEDDGEDEEVIDLVSDDEEADVRVGNVAPVTGVLLAQSRSADEQTPDDKVVIAKESDDLAKFDLERGRWFSQRKVRDMADGNSLTGLRMRTKQQSVDLLSKVFPSDQRDNAMEKPAIDILRELMALSGYEVVTVDVDMVPPWPPKKPKGRAPREYQEELEQYKQDVEEYNRAMKPIRQRIVSAVKDKKDAVTARDAHDMMKGLCTGLLQRSSKDEKGEYEKINSNLWKQISRSDSWLSNPRTKDNPNPEDTDPWWQPLPCFETENEIYRSHLVFHKDSNRVVAYAQSALAKTSQEKFGTIPANQVPELVYVCSAASMSGLGLLLFLYCQADWVSNVDYAIRGWYLTVAGSKNSELYCGPPDASLVGRYHTRYGMQRCFPMRNDNFWLCTQLKKDGKTCYIQWPKVPNCRKSANTTAQVALLHQLFDWDKTPEYQQTATNKFLMFRPGQPTDNSIRDFILGSIMRGNIRFEEPTSSAAAAAAAAAAVVAANTGGGGGEEEGKEGFDEDGNFIGGGEELGGGQLHGGRRRPMTFDELEEALAPALEGGASAFEEDDAEVSVASVPLAGGGAEDDDVTRFTDLENGGPGMQAPQSVSRGPKQMYDDLPDVDDDEEYDDDDEADYNPALGSTRARRATKGDDDEEEETTVLGGMM